MTLYLKYRPQKIADLDLVEIRQTLTNILQKKDLPHAFLFVGPRGTGKTSAARIVAKAINCPNAKKGEPCNDCAACEAITTGSAPDVVEIDAASNRGIDEIRVLRDNIKLAPLTLPYKVYIIDEVHMLTTEAANALLKTLEEPPAHVVFILCTTDPQKLPATVVSRCMQLHFHTPSLAESLARLEKIVVGEKMKADKNALELIADAGRGSFRDEVKILEQVWLTHGEITVANVQNVLRLASTGEPEKFLQLWQQDDVDVSLAFIGELASQGVNMRSFIEQTIEILHNQLLTTKSPDLVTKIQQLDEVYEQTKTTMIPQLPLEMLVIKSTPKPTTSKVVEKPMEEKIEKKPDVIPEKYKLEDVQAKWIEVLKVVKPKNHSVEALLRSTTPVNFDGHDLTLEAFYSFHKQQLESERCRTLVETAAQEVFGIEKVVLKLKLGTAAKKHVEPNVKPVEDDDILKAAQEIFKAN